MKYLQSLFFIFLTVLSTNLSADVSSKFFPKPIKNSAWDLKQAKHIQAPKFLSSVNDPDTDYQIWRLGGSAEEMGGILEHPDGNNNITLPHAQHFYSKTNPANLNETFAIGSAGRNHSYAALWRLKDKQLVAWVPSPKTESDISQRQLLWDKNIQNVYWYVEGNKLIRVELNLINYSENSSIWDTFPKFESITFGLGEGDFSDDGLKIVLVGKPKNHKTTNDYVILSYLVNDKKVLSKVPIKEKDGVSLDWAGVDPTGEFIIFNEPSRGNNTWVLPFNLEGQPRLLYKHIKHSDFVIDKNGEAWIAFGNWQGLFASKLSSPKLKRIWPQLNILDIEKYNGSNGTLATGKSASGHISRLSLIAGLVLLSRNKDGGLYYINIDIPGESLYVGNTRHGKRSTESPLPKENWGVDSNGEVVSSDGGKDYYREPRASASSSGKYIFFVSDYHVYGTNYLPSSEPKAYLNMIELDH